MGNAKFTIKLQNGNSGGHTRRNIFTEYSKELQAIRRLSQILRKKFMKNTKKGLDIHG